VKWITLDELLSIHQDAIVFAGGASGVRNPGALESALARPFTSFGGVEIFPGLEAKVAALIDSLIAFHPFIDGNKRTALAAANICLQLHGKHIIPSKEVEPYFWSIARGEQTIEEIKEWLNSNIEPWTDPEEIT
jgi:death on curing protein